MHLPLEQENNINLNDMEFKDKVKRFDLAKAISLSSQKYILPKHKPRKSYGKAYIMWGENNDYPEFLQELSAQAEHHAILSAKIDWISRGGFDLEEMTPEQAAWFSEKDMDSVVYKLTNDMETYGGFCFYVYRTRGGDIDRIEWEDFSKIRVADNPEEGEEYLVGEDWNKYRTETEVIPKWDPDRKDAKSLYYYTGPMANTYPLPTYFGAIAAIKTMIDIDILQMNLVRKGFFVPTVISFRNGVPDTEQQEEIAEAIKSAFTSPENAGELMVLFNNPDDEPIQVDTMETTDLDEKFKSIIEQKLQSIYSGHRVTNSALFGVKTPGQLGGRKELLDAWELFDVNYIKPAQETIEGVLSSVLNEKWNGIQLKLHTIIPVQPEIPEEQLYKNMTLSERRKELGLEDNDLSEEEVLRMKIAELPMEAQARFYESLPIDEFYNLIGYEMPAAREEEPNESIEE